MASVCGIEMTREGDAHAGTRTEAIVATITAMRAKHFDPLERPTLRIVVLP
jgi:hypothetical protein